MTKPEDFLCEEGPFHWDPPLKPESATTSREPRIRFYNPLELREFDPAQNTVLVGNCHIMRGEVFVIGGEPGVGKSTAATELAIAGATGRDWLGLPVHAPFKTLIVQNENGRFRLKQEYCARQLDPVVIDSILVSEPPPFGMTLNHPEFLADVKSILDQFQPDVVIFDPWNAAARDDKAAEYSAAFDALRNMLPTGDRKPALGIVAHTRKPKPLERRTGGSDLMHLLAGSYVLTSIPRCIFILVRGSLDETDNTVVVFNPKNSNAASAPRSVWERTTAGFLPAEDFDWKTFEKGEGGRKTIQADHIQEALGEDMWSYQEAVKRLMDASECRERACQKALEAEGVFGKHLRRDGKFIGWKD